MDSSIRCQLGMKRRREELTLPDRDDPTGISRIRHSRQNFDGLSDVFDPRRAYEYCRERTTGKCRQGDVRFKGIDLPTERVAAD